MRFLITAGPTREPIDPVRYLSNRSSGKMGYAIAAAAIDAGHSVNLISGPVCLRPPPAAAVTSVSTSDEMFEAVHHNLKECDILVMCAAVADYRPSAVSKNKIKKQGKDFSLGLTATRDILRSLPERERQFLVVGFAAETTDLHANARKKLQDKNCDIIVANDVGSPESGMESDENEVTIFFREGETKEIPRQSKQKLAHELVNIFAKMCEKRLTKKL